MGKALRKVKEADWAEDRTLRTVCFVSRLGFHWKCQKSKKHSLPGD